MTGRIYILCGGPGCGKSELLVRIIKDESFNAEIPPKYSNRERRDEHDDVYQVDENEFNKDEFTFVYAMNDFIYGFKAEDILKILRKGKNAFLIISDLRVIEEIKKFFGGYISVIYIFRNMSEQELVEILDEREKKKTGNISNSNHQNIRKNRLYFIQRQYVENLALFDHVILNRKDKELELVQQAKNILDGHRKEINPRPKGPVIFLIAAASGAGKKTLMDAMFTLGKKNINAVTKATDRQSQPGDGPEIVPGQVIAEDVYDINYRFNDNLYGFKSSDIWDNIKDGKPQILITNIDEFQQFKDKFGVSVVYVYLHATRTKEQIYDWQVEKLNGDRNKAEEKVKKMEVIHQSYVDNIFKFQHVLLNTIEKEDLWEQMFRLMKHYKAT